MIKIEKCESTNIYLLDKFLSNEQCEYIIGQFNKADFGQTVMENKILSRKLWSFVEDKMSDKVFCIKGVTFNIASLQDIITITKTYTPLGRHRDTITGGEIAKIFFYLNSPPVGGGTNFYESGIKKVEIANEKGSGVLFDISLEHESQTFPLNEIKYVIGARPTIKRL